MNYGKRSCGSIASRPSRPNSSHLILVDSLVNQTGRQKSGTENVSKTKTLNMMRHRNIRQVYLLFFFTFFLVRQGGGLTSEGLVITT